MPACTKHQACRLVCAGERASETLKEVDRSVVPWFRSAAAQLLQEVGDPEEALAMALAKVTGFSAVRVCPFYLRWLNGHHMRRGRMIDLMTCSNIRCSGTK